MFILTILIVYAPAFVKAKNKRKELKSNDDTTAQTLEQYRQEGSASNIASSAEGVVIPITEKIIKPKRRRGNPGKA